MLLTLKVRSFGACLLSVLVSMPVLAHSNQPSINEAKLKAIHQAIETESQEELEMIIANLSPEERVAAQEELKAELAELNTELKQTALKVDETAVAKPSFLRLIRNVSGALAGITGISSIYSAGVSSYEHYRKTMGPNAPDILKRGSFVRKWYGDLFNKKRVLTSSKSGTGLPTSLQSKQLLNQQRLVKIAALGLGIAVATDLVLRLSPEIVRAAKKGGVQTSQETDRLLQQQAETKAQIVNLQYAVDELSAQMAQ